MLIHPLNIKKLLLVTLLTSVYFGIFAQGDSDFKHYANPFKHWLEEEGYGQTARKQLWDLFKPDSVRMSAGHVYFEYNNLNQMTKQTFDITSTTSEEYQYENIAMFLNTMLKIAY